MTTNNLKKLLKFAYMLEMAALGTAFAVNLYQKDYHVVIWIMSFTMLVFLLHSKDNHIQELEDIIDNGQDIQMAIQILDTKAYQINEDYTKKVKATAKKLTVARNKAFDEAAEVVKEKLSAKPPAGTGNVLLAEKVANNILEMKELN